MQLWMDCNPTTLRLTASEFPPPSTAIDCCKSLHISRLHRFLSALHCYLYGLIATDFELAWAQKWAQSFQSLLDLSLRVVLQASPRRRYKKIANASYAALLEQSPP
jgi:hypothetical protein